MSLSDLMLQKSMSAYRLSKRTGISYMTIHDITAGKSSLEKCSAETVYKIADALNVSMEELLRPYLEPRYDFELFKSNVCHRLREIGDVNFIIEALEQDNIRKYYDRHWYAESFYLLAMLDYISRLNRVPICTRYDDLRGKKLKHPLYPTGILMAASASGDDLLKENALQNAIPEFLRFNIVESEVREIA